MKPSDVVNQTINITYIDKDETYINDKISYLEYSFGKAINNLKKQNTPLNDQNKNNIKKSIKKIFNITINIVNNNGPILHFLITQHFDNKNNDSIKYFIKLSIIELLQQLNDQVILKSAINSFQLFESKTLDESDQSLLELIVDSVNTSLTTKIYSDNIMLKMIKDNTSYIENLQNIKNINSSLNKALINLNKTIDTISKENCDKNKKPEFYKTKITEIMIDPLKHTYVAMGTKNDQLIPKTLINGFDKSNNGEEQINFKQSNFEIALEKLKNINVVQSK